MATAEEQRTEIAVHNPATGELIRSVHATTIDELRAMAERGRAAQPAWEALGFDGRGKILRRAQKWVTDNAERIAETLVKESGKTYEDALLAEVAYAANAFGFWAKHAPDYLGDEKVRTSNPFVLGRKLVVRYRPVGLVGVIGPWNYPLTNSFGDCIPAMAAGNAVILKPAEATPLTSLLLAEGMAEVGLPEGVYQVAPGKGSEIGPELVDLADMIMFTGSTETGKKIMARAADTLTPVSLELGGKDPMIVLRDADVERAANAAAFYSMQNGGQTCISVERVYVEEPVYDDFVARVAQKVGALRQGVPTAPGTVDVGAMTIPPQVDTVSEHVEDAKAAGAKVLVGGHARDDKGQFYEPTVLVDVDHSMAAMTEETFGPTLPIMKVRRRRRGRAARQRLAVRPRRLGVVEGRRARRGGRPPDRGRRGVRQRRADQLPRARAADGRLEDVGDGPAPRRARDPQVHAPAVAAGHAARAQEGPAHVPVQGADHEHAAEGHQAAVRAR